MFLHVSRDGWVRLPPQPKTDFAQELLRLATKRRETASRFSSFRSMILLCTLLFIVGCGQDQSGELQGGNAPTIVEIQLTPTSFVRAAGTGTITGLFSYVDPNADLSSGVLLIRECGQDPENRLEIPFTRIDDRTVGVFVVELEVPTNCEPGDYEALFFAMDAGGNTSNQIKIHYTIQPP